MKYLGLLVFVLCAPLLAAPVGWRMDGSGRFPKAAPQTQWGVADRVLWATDLPAWSNASPVLVGDKLIVCAEPDTLLCLDRTGKILWQKSNGYDEMLTPEERKKLAEERPAAMAIERKIGELRRALRDKRGQVNKAENDLKATPDDAALKDKVTALKGEITTLEGQVAEQQKTLDGYTLATKWRMPVTHEVNGYSSDTPVSDGKRVFASFGTGVVACYALDGTRQWIRLVEKPTHGWGHSGSPVLIGDTLVVQFIDTFGLDAKTGEERWRVKHPHVWGTPAVTRIGAYNAFFTDSGELINAADGKTLATTGMQLEYGSPLVSENVAYCVSGNIARAFKFTIGENGTVIVTKLWETTVSRDRYYASPLLHDGLVYVQNQQGMLSVLDAAAGTLVYEQYLKLGGTGYPSPVLAGNVIILSSDTGKSVVITPGREYKEVSRPVLEPFMSTPICDGTRMYIRTRAQKGKLYCIGE